MSISYPHAVRFLQRPRYRFRVVTLALSLSCAPLLPYSGAQAADHGGRVDQGSSVLPNLGDSSDMSPAAERRLGDRIARELYRDPDYLDDPVIMEYVNDIWRD